MEIAVNVPPVTTEQRLANASSTTCPTIKQLNAIPNIELSKWSSLSQGNLLHFVAHWRSGDKDWDNCISAHKKIVASYSSATKRLKWAEKKLTGLRMLTKKRIFGYYFHVLLSLFDAFSSLKNSNLKPSFCFSCLPKGSIFHIGKLSSFHFHSWLLFSPVKTSSKAVLFIFPPSSSSLALLKLPWNSQTLFFAPHPVSKSSVQLWLRIWTSPSNPRRVVEYPTVSLHFVIIIIVIAIRRRQPHRHQHRGLCTSTEQNRTELTPASRTTSFLCTRAESSSSQQDRKQRRRRWGVENDGVYVI